VGSGLVTPVHLIFLLLLALLLFGAKRLPEIGRTVGKSLREFRRASQDLKDELNLGLDEDDLPATRPTPGEPGFENWRTAPSSPVEGSTAGPTAGTPPSSQGSESGPAA